MLDQLQTIENKLSKVTWFAHGTELTADVKLEGLTSDHMDDIAGFFELKSKRKAVDYLRKLKSKYNKD